MAEVVNLRITLLANLDAGSITSMSAMARATLADSTDPKYQKSGDIDITDTLTPGSKTMAEWETEVLALAATL